MTAPKPPQGGPFFFQGDPGAPAGYRAVTQFSWSQHSQFADTYRYLKNLHNCGLWHKCLHCDLLDGHDGPYFTVAINADTTEWDATAYIDEDIAHPNFNDVTPVAPSGGLNVTWQSNSSSYVSAYVPFSNIAKATAVSTDYVVITDTSDSDNPKRARVSDITALVSAAPVDAQYVTLATNATLTNERVLTEGLGIDFADAGAGSTLTVTLDLGEIATGTPSGADTFVFVDADDQIGKRGTAADTLAALGAASSTTAVTQAAATTSTNAVFVGETGNRARFETPVIIDKSNGNTSGIGTLASGAHTITQATLGTVFRTEVSAATNDDPTEKFYHGRATTTEDGGAALFNLTPATDKRYTIEATVLVRQTTGAGTGTGRTIKVIADIENIGGTVTVTIVSNTSGGTLAVNSCTVTVSFGVVSLTCQVEGIVGSGKTYVHHAKIALFGPVGT